MRLQINDGGRALAGFRGRVDDCVVRAFAIAEAMTYREVYDDLKERMGKGFSPRKRVPKKLVKSWLTEHGWTWTPTMGIGTGCKVHLVADELPSGRLVVSLSRHVVAVIDGVAHDNHDPRRGGTRCVYGYWRRT